MGSIGNSNTKTNDFVTENKNVDNKSNVLLPPVVRDATSVYSEADKIINYVENVTGRAATEVKLIPNTPKIDTQQQHLYKEAPILNKADSKAKIISYDNDKFVSNENADYFYVNGILTDKETALKTAQSLSSLTGRTINLIHSETTGAADDADRTLSFDEMNSKRMISTELNSQLPSKITESLLKGKNVKLFVHSRGSSETANALWAVRTMLALMHNNKYSTEDINKLMQKVEVVTMGAFAVESDFPSDVKLTQIENPEDSVVGMGKEKLKRSGLERQRYSNAELEKFEMEKKLDPETEKEYKENPSKFLLPLYQTNVGYGDTYLNFRRKGKEFYGLVKDDVSAVQKARTIAVVSSGVFTKGVQASYTGGTTMLSFLSKKGADYGLAFTIGSGSSIKNAKIISNVSKETLLHKYWSSSFKSALEKSPEAASAVVKRAQKLGVNIATSTADDISLKLMKNGATTKLVEKGFNASFGMIGFGTKIADFGAKKISFGTGTKIGTAIEKNLGITLETNVAKFAKGSAVVGTLALIGYAGYKIKKSFDDHYVDSGPNNYLAQEKTQDFFKNFRPEKSTIKEGYSKVNIIGNDSRILVDDKLGLPIRVKVGADGTPLIIDGQPIPDPYGSFARVKIDDNGNPLMDSNGNYVFEKKNIDSLNVEKYINKESLALNKNKELLLIDKETGNPLTFRSDENGNPIFDEKGDLIQDPNGINLAIQIDNNGKPLKINGEYVFVNPSKQEDSKLPHSMERYLTGVTNKSFAKQIVGFASEKMISGASVLVPFTGGKTIGFGLKHEVSKTVTEILSKPNAFTKKASDVLVKDVFRDIPKYTIRNSKQFLESSQLYGKGVQSLSLKEAGQAAGGKIKAIRKSASEMTEVITNIAKTTSKEGIKEGGKAAYSTLSKTVVGSTEKALVEGLEKGLEKGVKSASKKIGKEALEKSLTSAANREVTVALEKATVKYATKTSSKIGSRLAGAIPVIGVTAGVAITAWDTKDAIEKSKDKNASVASKALAWTTVGLDVVSTGADASGVGAPIGVVASVAGIGTSILSDYLR